MLSANLVHTAAPWAKPRNQSSDAVTDAAIANEFDHFRIFITFGTSEAIPMVRACQISISCGISNTRLCRSCTAISFPCGQATMFQVSPSWLPKRRNEFAEKMRQLKGCWTRVPWHFRLAGFLTNPFADFGGIFNKFFLYQYRLNTAEIAKLSVLELIVALKPCMVKKGPLELRFL